MSIRLALPLLLVAAAGCAGNGVGPARGLSEFEYGRVGTRDGSGDHPATFAPIVYESALADLDYQSLEYPERGSDGLFPMPVLTAVAAALSEGLAGAASDEAVALELDWNVRNDPTLKFVNHLEVDASVSSGELHLIVRRFFQKAGEAQETASEHPLRIVPGGRARRLDDSLEFDHIAITLSG